MTTTPKTLIESKFAEVAETVQYPAADCITLLDKFTAINTGNDMATITVHLIPPGGTVDLSNAFTKAIPPRGVWNGIELVSHVLQQGTKISTVASAATISIRASGRQIT